MSHPTFRRSALTLLALLGSTLLASPGWAAPEAQVEPMEIDLGTVNAGSSFERFLTLTNVGDGTLVLEDVKTSCGCTAASVDGIVELGAGESEQIRVTFNSKNFEGPVTKKVTITTNASNKTTQVVLKADVYKPVRWEPKYVTLNKVSAKEPNEQMLKLQFDQSLKAKVEGVRVLGGQLNSEPSKLFTAEVGGAYQEGERDVVEVFVRLIPGLEPQRFNESLMVKTNLTGDQEELKIPVRGETLGRIRVSPQYAVMRVADPGEEVTRDVILTSEQGPFEVVSAEVANSPIEVEVIPSGEAQVVLRLHYTGEEPGANGVRQLRVETDDPEQKVIELPVRYNTRAEPRKAENSPSASQG